MNSNLSLRDSEQIRAMRPGGRRGVAAWALALCAALAGCAHAPGMSMDAGSDDPSTRYDLKTIDLPLARQLDAERRVRVAAKTDLPAAFRADKEQDDEYRIAPQDVLRVTVWNHPDLTNPHGTTTDSAGRVVAANGTIFFPHIGSIAVGGRTVHDVRERVTKGLARVIRAPQVDVQVVQFRGQRIQVAGEVRTPGTIAVTDVPPDLPEVIARAGGPTAEADLTAVTVTRGKDTLRLDVQALYQDGRPRANIRLKHGDIVNVPDRRSTRVYVSGEVNRPTSLPMPRGELTLAEALAEAGGVNPLSANAGQVFVIRSTNDTRAQVYHLNAAAPDALLLADQFPLQPRDVVYVDVAPVVRWSRMIGNILPSATFLRDAWSDTRTTRR